MRILVIGDTHAPFAHPGALDFLADLKRQYKPDVVVHIGDLGDQHGWSRHERLPDAPGQAEELSACRAWAADLYKLFPKALACVGNHEERLAMKASRAGLPSALHSTVHEIYESPDGWDWKRWHIVDGVHYQHGTGYTGQDCALKHARINLRSTVCGHVHSAFGVRYQEGSHQGIFAVHTGCLIDPRAIAFRYGREYAMRPVLGSCVVIDGVPIMEPLPAAMVEATRYSFEEAVTARPALAETHRKQIERQSNALAAINSQNLDAEQRRKLAAARKRSV